MTSIPIEWIKNYIDQLLAVAKQLDPGPLQDATLLRADHAMDMVEAWRRSRLK